MHTVWTNGNVALTKDLVFGLCILSQEDDDSLSWVPLTQLDLEMLDYVRIGIGNEPSFPWKDDFAALLRKAEQAEMAQ